MVCVARCAIESLDINAGTESDSSLREARLVHVGVVASD